MRYYRILKQLQMLLATFPAFQLPSVLPTPSSQLCNITITVNETFEALSALNIAKAMGCGNMSPKILKACATSLCEPVALVFNKSLSVSNLPTIWKCHKITPIPKSGDQGTIENFRPISLLCILLKVMESIIYDHSHH